MNKIYYYIIIILITFIIFNWIQKLDDNKYNINRKTLYEKYKNPILYSAIIGLIINIDFKTLDDNCNIYNYHEELTIYPPPF